MPTIKLTKREVERLPAPHPSGKQVLYWDAELKGFGMLSSGKTSAKTYIAQRKLPDGRTRRVTVGAVGELELDRARRLAGDLLLDLRHGKDPKAHRRSAAAWTLRRALDEYLAARKDLREKSRHGYRDAIERHLAPWLEMPISSITSDMVEARHREIQAGVERRRTQAAKKENRSAQPAHWGSAPGASTANGTMRAFRAIWNFVAERQPELPANPVRRLKRQWYAEPRRERLVKSDELPAFYQAVDALPSRTARDYLLLLLFTGLRREEAAALPWSEIDFTERVIRLPAKRNKGGRRLDLTIA